MPQASYWIVHLAMIAAGTFFMADMAGITLSSHLESLLENPAPVSNSTKNPDTREMKGGVRDYRVIVEKNIFNSEKKTVLPARTSLPQIPPPQVAVLPPVDLILIGTAVSKGGEPYAIIRDPKEKEQMLYRKGEVIGALGAGSPDSKPKILDIDRNKVVLLRGGEKVVLEVGVEPEKNSPVARQVPTPAAIPEADEEESVRQVADNQWLLDRRELDDAMKNLPELLTKARVIPSFKDGQPDGFRIFAISKDSLYEKIGLQNGDILHRINGVDVKSPQNFMKVIEQLKDESNVSVDLVRNNQKETFTYEIR